MHVQSYNLLPRAVLHKRMRTLQPTFSFNTGAYFVSSMVLRVQKVTTGHLTAPYQRV